MTFLPNLHDIVKDKNFEISEIILHYVTSQQLSTVNVK